MDYCSECMKPCDTVSLNYGFGRTEYWGAVSGHDDWQTVSKCCESEVLSQRQWEDLNELHSE